MGIGKIIIGLVIFGLLSWLIDSCFYWIVVGVVLTIIVSETMDPGQGNPKIRLTGFEIVCTGIIAGLVLYGIDWLIDSVI